MSIPVIAFFNNKGGVGKTTMVCHLAWMLSDHGLRVVAGDLDPQCNLTAAFIDEGRLEQIVEHGHEFRTIFGALEPLKQGTGDVALAHVENLSENLGLVVGDLALSTFEDELSEVWPKCLAGDPRGFRITSAFWRIMQAAGESHQADVILLDLGPNLGAINRAALIACDFVVIPLGPDLFSLQGLKNLGPALRNWRQDWHDRLARKKNLDFPLPTAAITPIGYMVLRHSIRLDRPVMAFDRWMARIPSAYATSVFESESSDPGLTIDTDPNCIAKLKDYRSLMPLAQEAHKPMFFLKPADGAMGAHMNAVLQVYKDFKNVADKIAARAGLKPLS